MIDLSNAKIRYYALLINNPNLKFWKNRGQKIGNG